MPDEPTPTAKIHEGMAKPELVPIEDLVPNPINTRRHEFQQIEMLMRSLDRYGQRRPLIVRRDTKVILSGNAIAQAAAQLGWTHIAVAWTDDTDADAIGWEVMDNRSAEIYNFWDREILAQQLAVLQEEGFPIIDAGFTAEDLQKMQEELTPKGVEQDTAEPPTLPSEKERTLMCPKCGFQWIGK